MGEPKAFASLSSGLLARKGAARPAMRPQGFGQVGSGVEDELGWNDMGFEPPKPAIAPVRDDEHDAFGEELSEPSLRNPLAGLTPIASPVHDQQAEIADRFAGYTDEPGDEDDEIDDTAELYDPDAEAVETPVEEPDERQSVTMIKPSKMAPVEVVQVVAPIHVAPIHVAPIAPARASRPRAAPGSKGKAAFTLRLDGERHLKLRLACAVTGRSAQQLVTDALDQFLGSMPELDTMAERAPKKRAS